MASHGEWLQAERQGQEELAEQLFARWVAEMTPVEPTEDFVHRTAQAAWRARTRHRLVARLVRVAAALLLGITAIGSLYAVIVSGFVVQVAIALSHGLVWLLTSAAEGARWWWIAQRIGTVVDRLIASPVTGTAIAGAEMAAVLAIYAFHRLFRNELQTRESRK